jgi:hypothetical protein
MPQQQGNQKQLTPEERNKVLDESMQRAYAKVSAEMPDVKKVSVTPSTSMLGRFFMPRGAMAVTNPFTGNVMYSPDAMQGQSQDDMEQTIAHELTHTRQSMNEPWYEHAVDIVKSLNPWGDEKVPEGIQKGSILDNPYYWRPREMEAFQAERDRAQRNKIPYYVDPVLGSRDIMLPSQKKQPGIDTGPRYAFGRRQ